MAVPSETDMELYCSNKKALIKTMCRTEQWGGVTEGQINTWLHYNFKDSKGKYFAIKILLNALCYSEANLTAMLKDGIYSKIFGERLKKNLVDNGNIHLPKSELESRINQEVDNCLFIPLLDSNNPSESGNNMIRHLVHKIGIKTTNSQFHYNVNLNQIENFKSIILVDDCLGSGHQIFNFWNKNESFQLLKNAAQSKNIEIFYLVLIANKEALIQLQIDGDLLGLKVRACEMLTEENKIFALSNNIWNGDKEELEEAINYFNSIEKAYQVPRLGYNKLDFAVFIHNSIPDWSLPIFWIENSNWKPLFRRKNSNNV